jgi:ADP-heptose:LPS heptosyltransferase
MQQEKKILLVQLFSNGDCLYATTIARQIKNDYPGCHLTWAIADFCKSIIAGNPYVDEIMEVNTVPKTDVAAFRSFKKNIYLRQSSGEFEEVFITHIMDTNQAFYDGSIRSTIFRAYPNPVTVPVQPILLLSDTEINSAKKFSLQNKLPDYRHVILFEFAPLSGQSTITKEMALTIAESLTIDKDVAVILSSADKIDHATKNIIDGSVLTLRETAALTHYCSLLIGCSSGITWISTSNAAKLLPMIQILNPGTTWINPVSRDFERFGIDSLHVIEMTNAEENRIVICVKQALTDFPSAKKNFNQQIPLQFTTTRNIIYNLLCYLEFGAIVRHININREVFGTNFSFYREVIIGFATSPFKLLKNIITKKFLKNYR